MMLGPGDAVRADSSPFGGIGVAGKGRSLAFGGIGGSLGGLGGVELDAMEGECGRRWISLVMAMARRTSVAIAEDDGEERGRNVQGRQSYVVRLGPARYVERAQAGSVRSTRRQALPLL